MQLTNYPNGSLLQVQEEDIRIHEATEKITLSEVPFDKAINSGENGFIKFVLPAINTLAPAIVKGFVHADFRFTGNYILVMKRKHRN